MGINCFNKFYNFNMCICNVRGDDIVGQTQTEANKKWQDKNKERAKYLSNRSRARSFIKNQALVEDLEELENLIKERKIELENESN